MDLSTIDVAITVGYALSLVLIATLVSREKAGHDKNAQDYFLAGKALPWWAVGASLIAANISAEQIIGMSGSGYIVGLAIASYEWLAAITLLIVGKYFLPVFLKRGIVTMPQFLEQRYNARVKTIMAVFWLILYTFVNLTAILWLGATAINTLTGLDLSFAMLLLAGFALAYSLYGGLKAIALTDIIQVVLLVFGGLLLTYIALDKLSAGMGPLDGFNILLNQAPEKFDMILSSDHPEYSNLPGLGVLLGGMWVMHFSYWGFNQYIIQRALGAKSQEEAQKGILFAALLKLLMPVIIVIPGIAAFLLAQDPESGLNIARPDSAYPSLMSLAPEGIRGLIFAALIAAIVSSLGSMMNSISTIFTLDIYKSLVKDSKSPVQLVYVGRMASLTALFIAVFVAEPLLGKFPQAFQFIQEFTGFFTPGICIIFLFGVFSKRATAEAAMIVAISSFILSLLAKLFIPEVPFMDRVGFVFIACCVPMILSIFMQRQPQQKSIDLSDIEFGTSTIYWVGSCFVVLAVASLYIIFW